MKVSESLFWVPRMWSRMVFDSLVCWETDTIFQGSWVWQLPSKPGQLGNFESSTSSSSRPKLTGAKLTWEEASSIIVSLVYTDKEDLFSMFCLTRIWSINFIERLVWAPVQTILQCSWVWHPPSNIGGLLAREIFCSSSSNGHPEIYCSSSSFSSINFCISYSISFIFSLSWSLLKSAFLISRVI